MRRGHLSRNLNDEDSGVPRSLAFCGWTESHSDRNTETEKEDGPS